MKNGFVLGKMSSESLSQCLEAAISDGNSDELLQYIAQNGSIEDVHFIAEKIGEEIESCELNPTEKENPRLGHIFQLLVDMLQVIDFDLEASAYLMKSLFNFVIDEKRLVFEIKQAVVIIKQFISNTPIGEWLTTEESLEGTLQIFGRSIPFIGDYECQTLMYEILCRMANDGNRNKWASIWFPDKVPRHMFLNLNPQQFDLECRRMLNHINRSEKKQKVFSFVAESVYMDKFQLRKPYGCDFWVDFNYGSRSISFYCSDLCPENGENSAFWETIIISEDIVESYAVQAIPDKKSLELCIMLNCTCYDLMPSSYSAHHHFERNVVRLTFWNFLDISCHVQKIFGRSALGLHETTFESSQLRKASNYAELCALPEAEETIFEPRQVRKASSHSFSLLPASQNETPESLKDQKTSNDASLPKRSEDEIDDTETVPPTIKYDQPENRMLKRKASAISFNSENVEALGDSENLHVPRKTRKCSSSKEPLGNSATMNSSPLQIVPEEITTLDSPETKKQHTLASQQHEEYYEDKMNEIEPVEKQNCEKSSAEIDFNHLEVPSIEGIENAIAFDGSVYETALCNSKDKYNADTMQGIRENELQAKFEEHSSKAKLRSQSGDSITVVRRPSQEQLAIPKTNEIEPFEDFYEERKRRISDTSENTIIQERRPSTETSMKSMENGAKHFENFDKMKNKVTSVNLVDKNRTIKETSTKPKRKVTKRIDVFGEEREISNTKTSENGVVDEGRPPKKSRKAAISARNKSKVMLEYKGSEKSFESSPNTSFLNDIVNRAGIEEQETSATVKPVKKRRFKKKSIFITDNETGSSGARSEVSWIGKKSSSFHLFATPEKVYSSRKRRKKDEHVESSKKKRTRTKPTPVSKKNPNNFTTIASDAESKSKSGVSDLESYKLVVEKQPEFANHNEYFSLFNFAENRKSASESDRNFQDVTNQDFLNVESEEKSTKSANRQQKHRRSSSAESGKKIHEKFSNSSFKSVENDFVEISGPLDSTVKKNSIANSLSNQGRSGLRNQSKGVRNKMKKTKEEVLNKVGEKVHDISPLVAAERKRKTCVTEESGSEAKSFSLLPSKEMDSDATLGEEDLEQAVEIENDVNEHRNDQISPRYKAVLSQESLSSLQDEAEGKKAHLQRFFDSISMKNSFSKNRQATGSIERDVEKSLLHPKNKTSSRSHSMSKSANIDHIMDYLGNSLADKIQSNLPSLTFLKLAHEVNTQTQTLMNTVQKHASVFSKEVRKLRESVTESVEEMIAQSTDFNEKEAEDLLKKCRKSRVHIQKSLDKITAVGEEYFEAEEKLNKKMELLQEKALKKYFWKVNAVEDTAIKILEERVLTEAKEVMNRLLLRIMEF